MFDISETKIWPRRELADRSGEAPLRAFEIVLEQSYVYRRVQSMEADVSFSTSISRRHGWDTTSFWSLDDVFSVLSSVALPISSAEISSIGPDLTFTSILSRTQALSTAPVIRPRFDDANRPQQQFQR